jgi:hypothetical protein
MGAVCAVVYLMSLIMFIPFAFYKDIVAATSGGGNRDVVIESQHIENGRFLHRFPHGKVGSDFTFAEAGLKLTYNWIACFLPFWSLVFAISRDSRDR